MRARDKQTAIETSGADVLSFRKKFKKTSGGVGNHPFATLLVRPRVKWNSPKSSTLAANRDNQDSRKNLV